MSKKNVEKTRIMLFGTFDGLHPGHFDFFKQARGLAENSFLIVSVARDKNVFKIKKYKPIFNEKQRVILLRQTGLFRKVVLAGLDNHIPHIVKERPDMIALGYDQKFYIKNLKKDLAKYGIFPKVFRLKPYKEKIYKNHLLNRRRYSRG